MRHQALIIGMSLLAAAIGQVQAAPFGTFDPRSLGMGGAGVAAGTSANASFFNPALLAAGHEDEDFSLELPIVGVRIADQDEMIDSLDNFQQANPTQAFSDAINTYTLSPTPANQAAVIATGNALITGLQTLSNKAIEAEILGATVIGIPSKRLGVSVYAFAWGVGGAFLDITQQDLTAISNVINNPPPYTDPTTTMTSTVNGRGAVIAEAGVSLAHAFGAADSAWALGITPKMQNVETFDYRVDVDTADIVMDQGTKSYSNFNLDIGVAKDFNNGWKLGVVGKNMIAETYKTVLGNNIEISPQARAGVAHQNSWSLLTLDLDLSENDALGFGAKTQYAALGVELDLFDTAQLRLGYRHNLSDSDTSIATAGLGFSPFGVHLDLGVAGSDKEIAAALQLGFRF